MRLLIGTSGYAYREWRGSFYPAEIQPAAMLGYYAVRFPAVEINSTFRRMPPESVLRHWADEVPDGFRFALKAPQYITHRKRLSDVAEAVGALFEAAAGLGSHRGPILFQLPPNLKKDLSRLEAFLELLPSGARAAVEFRHPSWIDDEVVEALRERGVALCIAHGEKLDAPPTATTDWGYLRLRAVTYDDDELRGWARAIAALPWDEAFVFLKHDQAGTAPALAQRLAQLARTR